MCECGRVMPSFGLPGQHPRDAKWCHICPTRPPESVNVVTTKRCECGKASKPTMGLQGDAPSQARWW